MLSFNLTYNSIIKMIAVLIILYGFHVLTPGFYSVGLTELDLVDEVDQLSGSNLFRQMIWAFSFLVIFSIFLKRIDSFVDVVKSKTLFPYYLAMIFVLGGGWYSEYGFISFRRSIFFVISSITLFSIVCLAERSFRILDCLKFCFLFVFTLDVVAVVFFNGIDVDGFFRGIHGQKNTAGSIYACFFIYFLGRIQKGKSVVDIGFMVMSLLFLVASFSKTSILIVVFFVLLWRISKFFNIAVSLILYSSCLMSLLYLLDFFDIPGDFLTGRGYIWAFLRYYAEDFLPYGYGYGSFWGVGVDSVNVVYGNDYIKLINSAHNGYIDALISGGVPFLIIILLHLKKHLNLQKTTRDYEYSFFCGFCFFSLIVGNLTESTMFVGQSFLWILYLISFFCLLNFDIKVNKKRGGL